MSPPLTEPAPPNASPVRLAAEPPRARILYVDDDPALRSLGRRMLMLAGYEVDTAEDGAAAWTALLDSHYALLVTDNEMPRVTGVELIRKLRLAGMTVPIILTSGSFDTLLQTDLARLECEALLAKPFTLDHLSMTVHEVLRASGSAQPPNGARVPTWDEFRLQPKLHRDGISTSGLNPTSALIQ